MGVGYCWLLCAPLRGIRFVAPRNIDVIRTKKLKKWCILVHSSGETLKRSSILRVRRVEECIIDASKNGGLMQR